MNYKKIIRTLNSFKYANTKTFLFILLVIPSIGFAQVPQETVPSVPASELTHEKKQAVIVLITGDTLKGLINFNEYGNRHIHLNIAKKPGETIMRNFDKNDSIKLMYIEGRGFFHPIKVFGEIGLAFVNEDETDYIEYKYFIAKTSLLGVKMSGGNIEGSYSTYLYLKRKDKTVSMGSIKKLDETIEEYIDYCPEITDKVKKEEKGYKKTLMKSNEILIKDLLKEAAEKCPKK